MTLKRMVGLLLALLIGGAVILLWPKEKKTPEDEVRDTLAKLISAIEKRDYGVVGDSLTDDFRGPSGMGKQETKQMLVAISFRERGDLIVLNPSLDVTVDSPGHATFKGTFVAATKGVAGGTGQDIGRYDIEGTCLKQGSEWKVSTAERH